MPDHLSPETLKRWLCGELVGEEERAVLEHLAPGCSTCEAALGPVLAELLWQQPDQEPPPAFSDATLATEDAYDAAIDRACAAESRELRQALRQAELVEPAYTTLVEDGLDGLQRGSGRRFQGPALCLAVLRRSRDMIHRDPQAMFHLAWFAARVADSLNPEEWGQKWVADLRSRAWAELGNSYRLRGNLAKAEESIIRAVEQFSHGSEDPILSARLLTLEATLLSDQRHFAQALDLLKRAEDIYKDFGESGEATRVLLKRGIYSGYAAQTREAIELLTRAVDQIVAATDPDLALEAVHSLAWFLMEAEEWRPARALLFENQELYRQHGGQIVLAKKTWLEGRIHAGLGRLGQAETVLLAAIKGLEAAGLGYDAAIAALDLAAVWLSLGRTHMAAVTVQEAADTFIALGIGREALAALHMLHEAFEQETVNAAIIADVARFLRRLEHDPSARFGSD